MPGLHHHQFAHVAGGEDRNIGAISEAGQAKEVTAQHTDVMDHAGDLAKEFGDVMQSAARVLADGRSLVSNHQFYLASRPYADKKPQVVAAIIDELVKLDAWALKSQKDVATVLAPQIGLDIGIAELATSRFAFGIKPHLAVGTDLLFEMIPPYLDFFGLHELARVIENDASEVRRLIRPKGRFETGPVLPRYADAAHPQAGFVVQDGNYLSARWPGDAWTLGLRLLDLV